MTEGRRTGAESDIVEVRNGGLSPIGEPSARKLPAVFVWRSAGLPIADWANGASQTTVGWPRPTRWSAPGSANKSPDT